MTLANIIARNTWQRRLSTVLTSLSVAVGVALILAILMIKAGSRERLSLGYSGFDLVIGAKGSPLQLTLNVVYNLDTSPGNIPFSLYEKLKKDPRIKWVVPYAVGDNYKGFRIVGTTDTYLKDFEPLPGQKFELTNGCVFKFQESNLIEAMKEAMARDKESIKESGKEGHHHQERVYEAVIGSVVAQKTGLKVGDKFVATHGVQETAEGLQHEEAPWTIVGALKQTGTPTDRAIYINLDSFYHIAGHVIEGKKEEHHQETSKENHDPKLGEISALAIKARSPLAVWALRKEINERNDAQAATPVEEIHKLLTIVGNVDRILLTQAILIVVVAAIGTGLAMFNSMSARRRDIAIMRALGAKRRTIFAIIVGEAVLISAVGAFLGLFLGHGVVALASPSIEAAAGFMIPAWGFHPFELILFASVLLVGTLAGIGPAISAYRTNVATGLSLS